MTELVTVEQAERVLRLLAATMPVAGMMVGIAVGVIRRRLAGSVIVGLLIGLAGPTMLGLWHGYNAIMNRYGLDSVRGLLISLALFTGIGLVIGMVVGWRLRRHTAASTQETAPTRGG